MGESERDERYRGAGERQGGRLRAEQLTHSRSVALSIFMKSCLARTKISGSSLEQRG